MILLDRRAGSIELEAPLKAAGLPIDVTTLEHGDLLFQGRGEGGKPVYIGVEYKKLGELVSSLRTGRLQGHQLYGMQRPTFDYSYLLIEGELLYDKYGKLLKRRGRSSFMLMPGAMSVSELFKRIHVLHLVGGLNPAWVKARRDTVQWIHALYRVWTDSDLDKHKSHLTLYQPPTLIPLSPFRNTVRIWPGIGIKTSLAVERHFEGSLRRAVQASATEWAEIRTTSDKGKVTRLGEAEAQRLVAFFK